MFIYEYGTDAYNDWDRTISLRQYEQQLRARMHLPPGSPIVDEHEKGQY